MAYNNLTFTGIKNDGRIACYIREADKVLASLGYTEHNMMHANLVAINAGYILGKLGRDARTVDMAQIAGYMHDIGNIANRVEHSQSGAVMTFCILERMGFRAKEVAQITSAIGNHDEHTGLPVNDIAAALILADKADVRRGRVRNQNQEDFDIHDRVNYSVTKSELTINEEKTEIALSLTVDTEVSSVMTYFEIFLDRMLMCKRAAEKLGLEFKLVINEQVMT